MSYDKLNSLLEDERLRSFIKNIASGYMEMPYIMNNTLDILEDDSVMCNIISDNNKKALAIMLDQYFTDCFSLFVDDMGLDKLLEYGKITVYKVDAANGLRYATTNEIAQGIKGLIGENVYPAGENEYKLLCLLQWSFTGVSYFFRQAGYKLDYDENGKVKNTFYEMIQMCAYQLKELFQWISVKENLDKALKKITKMKSSKGYKYASFEKDEITESITIKQLVYNIQKVFPRNSPNVEYRRALALSLKAYKGKQKLTPLEVSTLRDIYDKHALDRNRGATNGGSEIPEVKNICETLLNERYSGKINPKHFAYTIIETLRTKNYSQCSPKQLSILEDAMKHVNKSNDETNEEPTENTEIISDNEIDSSLESLSNAIGQGLFEEEDIAENE